MKSIAPNAFKLLLRDDLWSDRHTTSKIVVVHRRRQFILQAMCAFFHLSSLFFCLSLLNTSFISKCANRWNQKMHTLLEHVQTESGLQIRFWPCDHFQLIPIWFRKVVSRWIRIHSKEAREKTQQQQQNHTIKWKIEFKGEKEIRFVCRQVQAINKSVYNANDSSGWNKQKKE